MRSLSIPLTTVDDQHGTTTQSREDTATRAEIVADGALTAPSLADLSAASGSETTVVADSRCTAYLRRAAGRPIRGLQPACFSLRELYRWKMGAKGVCDEA
jgi:hypothetical protein